MEIEILSGKEAVSRAATCAGLHEAAFSPSGSRSWSEAEFRDLLCRETVALIYTANAFLLLEAVFDEAEVLTVAVAPHDQRKGRGGRLLEALVSLCNERGVSRCFLEVAVDNQAAIALYERHEFSRIATRRDYFQREGKSIHALVMERLLP